jgi:hypothetical protein
VGGRGGCGGRDGGWMINNAIRVAGVDGGVGGSEVGREGDD